MKRMLDTNICSYFLRWHPPGMLERVSRLERAEVWLSAIVAAELRFGAAKLQSARFQAAVESWLAGFEIRVWPAHAGHHYAQVRAELERKGNMDLLIAAHALAEDAVLVTNNAREFLRVPGLAVEEWSL
jgi:tRNA(fMet)-specific endonuclease VapC